MGKRIAAFFADRTEIKECRYANGYTVLKVTTTWTGYVRDVEVLERVTLWNWPTMGE